MRFLDWLVWVILGGGMAASAAGCGPALFQQVQLRQLADRAKADCVAAKPAQKSARCEVALVCAKASQEGVKAIQTAQEARAAAGATSAQEAVAAGSYAAAVASCGAGGWR